MNHSGLKRVECMSKPESGFGAAAPAVAVVVVVVAVTDASQGQVKNG